MHPLNRLMSPLMIVLAYLGELQEAIQ
jgi:hypothetical protein